MVAVFTSGPGQTFVFSVFVDPILADTGMSRTELSFLYSVGTVFSAIMSLVISHLVGKFGPRIMMVLIALFFGAACFGISWASGSLAFLAFFAALRALGQGSLTMTAILLTVQWFVRYRGRAIGMVSMGMAAANAFFPPFCQWLISAVGWRPSYQILGVAIWLLVIPAAVFIVKDRPEKIGLFPDGLPPELVALKLVEDKEEAIQGNIIEAALEPEAARVWRSWRFWQLVLPLSAGPFVITALIFHQISILAEHGQNAQVSSVVFVVWAASSAIMTAFSGFLLERFEPKLVLLGVLVFLIVGALGLLLVNSLALVLVYAVIMGSAAGSLFVISGVIWAHYYGRKRVGVYQGAGALVNISGAALAPLPLAALQQLSGNYTAGVIGIACVPALSFILLLSYKSSPRPHQDEE
jgi:MFS family permease